MRQIFRPNANIFALVSIFAVGYIVVAVLWGLYMLDNSNYARKVNIAVTQPVPYNHQLHAGSLGMDCRYCHEQASYSSYAGIPPTETCITCHHEVLQGSEQLQPVWESYNNDTPIEWIKVHDIPDHAYFNHSPHVNAGFGCSTCHGRVDQMNVVWRAEPLTMGWCLDCHRNPEQYIRPVDEVWNMEYDPQTQLTSEQRQQLVQDRGIDPEVLSNCYQCHR